MRKLSVALVAMLCLAAPFAYGAPPDPIGTVRSIDGDVVLLRNGQGYKAGRNLALYEGDTIETGSDGKAALVMADDTLISLGRKSTLTLARFNFQPQKDSMFFLVRMLKGTASFLCGKIAKMTPVRIETPQAAIGVRGSHVLVKVD